MKTKNTITATFDKDWFSTLHTGKTPLEPEKYVKLPVQDYAHLGYLINDIVRVCTGALFAVGNDETTVDIDNVISVLSLVNNLIPHNELELLEKLHFKVQEKETD